MVNLHRSAFALLLKTLFDQCQSNWEGRNTMYRICEGHFQIASSIYT